MAAAAVAPKKVLLLGEAKQQTLQRQQRAEAPDLCCPLPVPPLRPRPQSTPLTPTLTCCCSHPPLTLSACLPAGGTRFIGLYLARMLVEAGHEVTLLTRGKKPVDARIPDDTGAGGGGCGGCGGNTACCPAAAAALMPASTPPVVVRAGSQGSPAALLGS